MSQFIFSHDFSGSGIPNNEVTIFISRCQVKAVGRDRDASDTSLMVFEVNRHLCRERLEVLGRRQVRDEGIRVFDIDFLLHQSGA